MGLKHRKVYTFVPGRRGVQEEEIFLPHPPEFSPVRKFISARVKIYFLPCENLSPHV